jgi:hypothetical protein
MNIRATVRVPQSWFQPARPVSKTLTASPVIPNCRHTAGMNILHRGLLPGCGTVRDGQAIRDLKSQVCNPTWHGGCASYRRCDGACGATKEEWRERSR